MKLVPVQCRTHGGIFRAVKKPGRRPVKCSVERPCNKAGGQDSVDSKPELPTTRRNLRTRTLKPAAVAVRQVSNVERVASEIKNKRLSRRRYDPASEPGAMVGADNSRMPKTSKTAVPARKSSSESIQKPQPVQPSIEDNNSLPLAMKAKAELLIKGWEVVGEAWIEEDSLVALPMASITATRDDEVITILWASGEKIDQQYSIWDNGNMSKNVSKGKPTPNEKLGIDLDELSDVELIRLIAGQEIKWVNKLSGNEDKAVVSPEKFRIDHTFVGSHLDSNPGDRIINFLDHKRKSFRAIHVSALCSIQSPTTAVEPKEEG